MLRRGALRLQQLVKVEESLLAERLSSSNFAHVGPGSTSQLLQLYGKFITRRIGTSAQPAGLGLPLPLRSDLFSKVPLQNEGVLARFYRRLFSTGNKPRGFENFMPRGLKGGSTPKVEPKKVAEQVGGSSGSGGSGGGNQEGGPQFQLSLSLNWLLLGAAVYYLWSMNSQGGGAGAGPRHEISFQEFRSKLLAKGLVTRLEVANNTLVRVYVRPDAGLDGVGPAQGVYKYYFQVGSLDSFERKLDEAQHELGMSADHFVPVKYVREISLVSTLLEVMPTLLLLGATYWLISRQMRNMGGGFPGMGGGKPGKNGQKGGPGGFFGMVRANTGTIDKKADKIMFKDVAGCDEAKLEIMEFVDFLKKPDKYKDLGAKIPKGALLVGPPGTGKTLLAKATAGEAGVPFLSISGSDFMEMFVGVGPARVRDLFAQARTQSPSMIFIDEIDAIGRARGRGGAMGGHDERENTLNQLLVEMDGFATTTGVVVLGGTNRPDILDKALLRPGRFDRMITVDTPDIKGRDQIFRVHLGKLKLEKEIDFYSERLAALTPGMSGADIANVCNEAALVAARHDKEAVEMVDFETAIDRVIGGLEKKNKVISPEERRTVAFHESGHAVVSWFLQYAEPLLKVSIVPRGASVLGFAQYLPNENLLLTKEQLLDRICAILGGRAAEQVLLGKISTGAVNDLERVTQMAYAQVAVYGMNEKIGLLSYRMDREAFDKPYSNETAHMIDSEVRAFVDDAYKRTLAIVESKRDLITNMSMELLKKEVLALEDVERILGNRPFESAELRNIDRLRGNHGFKKAKPADDAAAALEPVPESGPEGGADPPSPKTPELGQDSKGEGEEGASKKSSDGPKGGKGGPKGGLRVKPGSIVAT